MFISHAHYFYLWIIFTFQCSVASFAGMISQDSERSLVLLKKKYLSTKKKILTARRKFAIMFDIKQLEIKQYENGGNDGG